MELKRDDLSSPEFIVHLRRQERPAPLVLVMEGFLAARFAFADTRTDEERETLENPRP